ALQPPEQEHTAAYLELLMQPVAHGGAGISPLHAQYLRQYWYSPDGFWPHERYPFHPTEPIIRLGLIKAIDLAVQFNLLLDSYWIAAGEIFDTLVLHSGQQITRIELTPPAPPHGDPSTLGNWADIWVAKHTIIGLWETPETPVWDNPLVLTRLKKLSG